MPKKNIYGIPELVAIVIDWLGITRDKILDSEGRLCLAPGLSSQILEEVGRRLSPEHQAALAALGQRNQPGMTALDALGINLAGCNSRQRTHAEASAALVLFIKDELVGP